MDIVVSSSIIAAFVAGIAALLAPCCVTVLLPSYLGSIFSTRRKVYLMTFIFFLGILAVFLPLGFGISYLGQALNRYHNIIYTIGGSFLVVLGLGLVLGKKMKIPMVKREMRIEGGSAGSVFMLGIFSGIATSCCAPVLAGVLAMSAVSGSVFWGVIYTMSYVLGMVAPLFVLATLMDKRGFSTKLNSLKRPVEYGISGIKFRAPLSEIVSGAIFALMGGLILYLTAKGKILMSAAYAVEINIFMSKLTQKLDALAGYVPSYAVAIAVLAVLVLLVRKAIKSNKKLGH